MILKGSQRSGGKQLGAHLLKTEENEHVEVHEVSGFVSDTVQGAMMEAYALSKGSKCKQYLFSLSLNPPEGVAADVSVFENALALIEKQMGLEGQPRIVVFHEKEGRRHCHAVWSRIDAETMTAKPLPFFKLKLRDVAMQLFLDNKWELPKGFIDKAQRDPRNFTLDEWQKAKRGGWDPKMLKAVTLDCWRSSDNAASFARALEERGLFLARGDRRGHVITTLNGDVHSVPKVIGERTKVVVDRLGDPDRLAAVGEVQRKLGGDMGEQMRSHITEAKRIASTRMKPLLDRKALMSETHKAERRRLVEGQALRRAAEMRERSSRIRHGVLGAWDVLTGRYAKTRRLNETEALQGLQRDSAQRDDLVRDHMRERSELQQTISRERERQARQVLGLYRDAAEFRRMRDGLVAGRETGPELGR